MDAVDNQRVIRAFTAAHPQRILWRWTALMTQRRRSTLSVRALVREDLDGFFNVPLATSVREPVSHD
jgi:hypothetical protein